MKVLRVIYKYPVEETASGEFSLDLPRGAKFLCVQMQPKRFDGVGSDPQMWFLVDPKKETTKAIFKVIGTGNEFDNTKEWGYLGTWQDGPLVWHLFE